MKTLQHGLVLPPYVLLLAAMTHVLPAAARAQDAQATLIRYHAPDLIGLQEALPDSGLRDAFAASLTPH